MEQHPFDTTSRVTAKMAGTLAVESWSPPTISDAGHLVYAEPRTVAKPAPVPDEAAIAKQQAYDAGFKSGREAGFESGKQEGLEAGKQEAITIAKQEIQPKLQELNQLLTSLSHGLNEEDYKLEKTLLDLVQQIARAVISKELALDPGSLMKVIKETIAALPPSRDNIKILLNPGDKAFADDAIEAGGEHWHVIADEDIARGGCKVVTEQSEADMTVENRFTAVLEQVYEQQATCPKPGEPGFESAPEPAVGEQTVIETGAEPEPVKQEAVNASQATGQSIE